MYVVFVLETVQTVLTDINLYYLFVIGFGDIDRLKKHNNVSAIDGPTMKASISLIVQGFYCY